MNEDKTKDKTGVFVTSNEWDTFICPNGLEMVKGNKFNWQLKEVTTWKERPYVSISMHNNGKALFTEFIKGTIYHVCTWYPNTRVLIINDPYNSISLSTSFEMAEIMVESFIKANNLELMPLYKKTDV